MNEIVTAYPDIAAWMLGGMATTIGFLVYGILFFVKRSFDGLTRAILKLERSLASEKKDMGVVKNRLQKIETQCATHRNMCPGNIPIMGQPQSVS